jgi:hypothetical protein
MKASRTKLSPYSSVTPPDCASYYIVRKGGYPTEEGKTYFKFALTKAFLKDSD